VIDMSFTYRPAISFTERHGVFVGLSGGTNSGKTFSALRLARGIAGPKGKIAVQDTEGGRTLHLKRHFDFDVNVMDPPFRPARFAEAAKDAENAGYDVLLIDTASAEWRGMGGVLEWQEEEFARMGGQEKNKLASWIKPKMAHKAMVYSLLQRRIPIIFSLRAEEKVEKKGSEIVKRWAPVCNKEFPFELTVSFMLQADNKGFIDLSDARTFKMEGAHKAIFRNGDQLSEEHGAALAAWARDNPGHQSSGAPSDVYAVARAVAMKGTAELSAWWSGDGRPHQKALADKLADLKAMAASADAGGDDGSEEETATIGGAAEQTADPADEWSLLDADGWLAQLYAVSDIIDACTTAKALSVIQAAPKFAGPYQAMKKHSPKTAEAVDEMVAKRREALSA
jgi:hypothetical protein